MEPMLNLELVRLGIAEKNCDSDIDIVPANSFGVFPLLWNSQLDFLTGSHFNSCSFFETIPTFSNQWACSLEHRT